MHCHILQDWVTLRGSPTATVVQSETQWLDLGDAYNAAIWLDVKEVSLGGGSQVSISYETAPAKDESLFVVLPGAPMAIALGTTITAVAKDLAAQPILTWLRWKLSAVSASSTWDVTFRVFVALR